jgi:hypothetical protein
MKLQIGMLGSLSPGWKMLMEQEGLPYSVVTPGSAIDEYSVAIAADSVDASGAEWIRKFLKIGGAVLCSGEAYSRITGISCSRENVRYILPSPGAPFSCGLIDVNAICSIPTGANHFVTDTGKSAVYIGEWGGGTLVVLPFDAGEIILDSRSRTKSFYANRSRLPFEIVSSVSKGEIRKIVARALELLHHRRGLPYVHTWYFPNAHRSIFALRIDTDYASREQIERLHAIAAKHKVRCSWFVDVGSQEKFLDVFSSMRGQEIGIHCYEHKTYPDKIRNIENIGRAAEQFGCHGIQANSFAAPYGTWNEGIGGAIASSGFVYSSEFSYDYDNLPSQPVLGGKELGFYQLPVHPISIGTLSRQGFSSEEMRAYFRVVIESKYASGEPLIFYHHPGDGNQEALEVLFGFAKERNIPNMTLMEYVVWWKNRCAANPAIEIENNHVSIIPEHLTQNVLFRVSLPGGKEYLTGASRDIALDALPWEMPEIVPPLRADIARIRKFNPWVPLIRLEDAVYKYLPHKKK